MKPCVKYRGLELYFKLPFARFVDSLLLRLASKTEMKCNSCTMHGMPYAKCGKDISRPFLSLQICVGTLLRWTRTHIYRGLGFLSVLYFLPVILCPLSPNQITFCFIKILQVFNYLFRISLHASFHGIKFPFQHFFSFFPSPFHKYNALDQFISSFPSTIKIIFKNLLMERNFLLLNHYHPIKYPPLISFIT